jgi:uncharacterized protein YdeI (YjbR/CyaY-like superfamily)
MKNMNADVAQFFDEVKQWKKELQLLRTIILPTGLDEEYKWKHPCYCYQGKNIVIIHGFKEYFAVLFFNGALLKDKKKLLIKQTEKTQSARQLRFTNLQEAKASEKLIQSYIQEAIENEKAGLKVALKNTESYTVPLALEQAFKRKATLKKAFDNLTPGRQRAYLLYFSEAKQAATQELRVERYTQRILDGKGLNDCTCGLSKRMPNCDGSHKQLQVNT